jgi:uncharacterized membrane protein
MGSWIEERMIETNLLKNIAGIILIFWGYFDAIKYYFQAQKIRELRSAKGNSRKFINMAIGNDLYRLFYFYFIDKNYYVLATSVLALICMIYLWNQIYWFYPYRCRGLDGFKRSSIMLFLLNSFVPNKLRKRL